MIFKELILPLVLLLIGFVCLIKGADFFVDGASSIAKKLKVPSLIIGLTIVALGTSLPEFAVSFYSALNFKFFGGSSADIALSIGNVIGSNIFNTLVVLGATCLIIPVAIELKTLKFEMPFVLGVTALLALACFLGGIKWYVGLILIALLFVYIFFLIYRTKKETKNAAVVEEEVKEESPIYKPIIALVIGAAVVCLGGFLVNDSAKKIASFCGMGDDLIALTVVALGTSLPELATSIIASRKKENDIALGNVVGSNILNILFILGFTSIVTELNVERSFIFDVMFLLIITVILIVMMFITMKKQGLGKISGFILLGLYVVYMAYIICRNYNALPEFLTFGL